MNATLELQVSETTKTTSSVLTVHDKNNSLSLKNKGKAGEISIGKYKGLIGVSLGLDPVGSQIYSTYEALIPKQYGVNFKITVIERQYDSYNYHNNYSTMVCRKK